MSARLEPIENPKNPLMKLAYWLCRRRLGVVMSPLKTIWARMPLSFTLWLDKIPSLQKQLPLPEELALLIRTRVAQLNSCAFCIDLSTARALRRLPNAEKFFALEAYENSPLFTEREQLALQLATELTEHKKIRQETFVRASKLFSEQQLIGLAWLVSSEHVYNLMNHAFEIGPDGLCRRQEGNGTEQENRAFAP